MKQIYLIVHTSAIIDDELGFFETVYNEFVKTEQGKIYAEGDLSVFMFVSADFSSGSGLFIRKDGKKFRDSKPKEWKELGETFKKLNLKTAEDINNCKEISIYAISIYFSRKHGIEFNVSSGGK